MVITTSRLNTSIVFSHSIFWGTRADEMGPEGRGSRAEDKGRESRNTTTQSQVAAFVLFLK